MNEHSTPQPATTGTSPVPSIDLVAGDPPVPITVWRTARSDRDTSRSVPARLAYRMVAAYSRPGEAVIDLTDGHALTEVAVAGGRVHHKAWLSDVATPTAVIAAEIRYRPVQVERAVTLRAAFHDSLAVAVRRSSRTPGCGRSAPPACRPSDTVQGAGRRLQPTARHGRRTSLVRVSAGHITASPGCPGTARLGVAER